MNNDGLDPHAPTPEFYASLEREIARAFRAERQFTSSRRARRAGMVIGIAAAAVFTLTIGLVLGVNTGYASAEVVLRNGRDSTPRDEPPLAILRSTPMKNAISALTCNAVARPSQTASAQQGVPIVELPPAKVKTTSSFGVVLGVREVAGSKVLVNDGGRRQIKLLDSTLAVPTVVLDSAPGGSRSYGPQASSLVRYVGDSSLFADYDSRTLLVLDERGQVARATALPVPFDFWAILRTGGGIDDKGRIVYRALSPVRTSLANPDPTSGASRSSIAQPPDSIEILRADLDLRRTDTLGRLRQMAGGFSLVPSTSSDQPDRIKRLINPLTMVDDWTTLSDGTIAFVRGHDYHVDWIHPDGTRSSTTKLPFDWKRLSDDDKQRLLDSARAANDAIGPQAAAFAMEELTGMRIKPEIAGQGRGGGGGGDGGGRRREANLPIIEYVTPKDMVDYYPPIRRYSSMPDLDGNLWILPTTSAQSKQGELVYDVVNPKRGLFERVRMPIGRSIAGFGKDGVVYLLSGDRTTGFYLERTRMPPSK